MLSLVRRVPLQFLVFLSGGVLCALIDIGLMQFLIGRGTPAVPAATAGFLAGLGVNYAFHAKVTFRKMSSGGTVLRYLCIVVINYLITTALVATSDTLLHSALIGKLVSLPVISINSFLSIKYWVFRER